MEIMGRTTGGLIVKISEREFDLIVNNSPVFGRNVGDTYELTDTLDWSRRFREHERAADVCADRLRVLADMITNGLPSIVVPPPVDTPPPARED